MNTQQTEEKYLNTLQVAQRLSCHPVTVRAMVHRGELEVVQVGRVLRFPPDAVDKLKRPARAAA